ncbi:MAG: hypothetical protein WCD18_07285 [Thermosynechococcaceae cyanobacterium]
MAPFVSKVNPYGPATPRSQTSVNRTALYRHDKSRPAQASRLTANPQRNRL